VKVVYPGPPLRQAGLVELLSGQVELEVLGFSEVCETPRDILALRLVCALLEPDRLEVVPGQDLRDLAGGLLENSSVLLLRALCPPPAV